MKRSLAAVIALLLSAATLPAGPTAEVVSVAKIWDAAPHNAFTDLIRFHDQWYCTFRESQAHVGGDGKIRLLVSEDGEKWTSAALIAEEGVDLRDPKVSITPEGRLMLVMGGSRYEGKKLLGHRPRVAFSSDGAEWTKPEAVLAEGDWLWRVTWDDGKAYGTSYKGGALALYRSDDGVRYEKVTDLAVPDFPNETTLRFTADHTMVALVRREKGNKHAWVGSSRPPYTQWAWHEVGHFVGGPNFLALPDGSFVASGREMAEKATTVVADMTLESYTPLLTLPSGGDCSYPGMVMHDGVLWESYYSSHEGKTAIYLARVKVGK